MGRVVCYRAWALLRGPRSHLGLSRQSPGTFRAPVATDAQVSLANLTAGHALQPLVPRPQAPGSGSAWGREAAGPPRALHLKEISWDPQKPATLIAGILFLVSFEGSLQVLGVISREPAWSLGPIVPQPFPCHAAPAMTPNKNGESRLPRGGAGYGREDGAHTQREGCTAPPPPTRGTRCPPPRLAGPLFLFFIRRGRGTSRRPGAEAVGVGFLSPPLSESPDCR